MLFFANEIESNLLGLNVVEIRDFSHTDVEAVLEFEKSLSEPTYVFSKIILDDIPSVNILERIGYEVVEVQINSKSRLTVPVFNDSYNSKYSYNKLVDQSDLDFITDYARHTLAIDRFSKDRKIAPEKSSNRIVQLLEKSFYDDDEEIWILRYAETSEILSFRSHRRLDLENCRLLLGSISPRFLNIGIGEISWYFARQELIRQKYKNAHTTISAANTSVFNLEIGSQGFRVQNTVLVCRKFLNVS
jgi:hypothetical protein